MSKKTQVELIVCKNFRLIKKLGTGAFGQIYLAQNRTNPNQKYAAKLQQVTTKFPQLYFEAKMYKYLSSFETVPGIPKVYAVTTQGQYNVMLMDLLGKSLEDLFVQHQKKFSLKTVLMCGEQMVERIQFLHEKNIIHRDIKPDNFLMGINKTAHLVFLVDFGLSKKFITDNKHIPYKEGKQLTGTARYASINTHMGIEQSRRDDIESIGYVMMYMLRGILPWQNMKAKDTKTKYKMIMEKKISTPAEFLCKGYPSEMTKFINYAKGLKFQEKPDYKYLKNLLISARKQKKLDCDYNYDWTSKMGSTNISFNQKASSTKKIDSFYEKKRTSQAKQIQKVENKKIHKDEAINEALNNFQVTGGSLLKNNPKMASKEIKSSKQMTSYNTKNTLLGSGLETLGPTKITAPKISVVRR